MTLEIAIVLIILLISITLFLLQVFRLDVTALLVMLTLGLSGILTREEALAGFSNPAVITILGIFMLTAGLENTGVTYSIGRLFQKFSGASEGKLILIIMLSVAALSSIMSNVAATAILLPSIIGLASRVNIPPSRLLIPLSFGSVIGGMITQIGTPPNLIVSGYLTESGLSQLELFDFTPLALLILCIGIFYMLFIGRKLLPNYTKEERMRQVKMPAELASLYGMNDAMFEVKISPTSSLVSQSLQNAKLGESFQLFVVGILRKGRTKLAPDAEELIEANDTLLITAEEKNIKNFCNEFKLDLHRMHQLELNRLSTLETGLIEATIAPHSKLEGRSLREINFRERYGASVVGLWRDGDAVRFGLSDIKLKFGDALLLQGHWNQFQLLKDEPDIILLSEIETHVDTSKGKIAVAILLITIILMLSRMVPISLAALSGGVLMVISGCLGINYAYRKIEWNVLFMIAGILPLGTALAKTGTAQLIAETTLAPIASIGFVPLLTAIFLLTVILAATTSNSAAAVLMGPIALNIGIGFGIDPKLLMLTVAYGASSAFLTPIAQPAFMLVMGPGGYRFKDYFKVGAFLSLIIGVTVVLGLTFLY